MEAGEVSFESLKVAEALLTKGEGDEGGACPDVEELLVDVELDLLLEGTDAAHVATPRAYLQQSVEHLQVVLLVYRLSQFLQSKVY